MPEQALSRSEHYAARPTVRVNGQGVTEVTELLTSMRVEESEGGLSALELRLDNNKSLEDGSVSRAFEDERVLRLGAEVTVGVGDESDPREVFRGKVTGLEAEFSEEGAALTVLAEDALQRARMARRTRVHESLRLADLAGQVAQRLGLRPMVRAMSDDLGLQVQFNESDLAFLRRLLWSRDGDVQVVGEELHVAPRPQVQRATLELTLHGQLRRIKVLADLAHQTTRVTVGGWNARSGARASGEATRGDLGPGRGRVGSDLLREAIGERVEHLAELPATSDAEARALASAAFTRRARRFVCAEGTAEGNPALRVGTHVRLIGMSARFDNTYYVVRACHRYDAAHGYETDFEAECGWLGNP